MAQAARLWQTGAGRTAAARSAPAAIRQLAAGRVAATGRVHPQLQHSWARPLRLQPAAVRPLHRAGHWRLQAADAEPQPGSEQELNSSTTAFVIRCRRSTRVKNLYYGMYENLQDLQYAKCLDGVWFYPNSGGDVHVGIVSGVPQGSLHLFGGLASANAVAAEFWGKLKERELSNTGWEPSLDSESEDDKDDFLYEGSEYSEVPITEEGSGVRPDGCRWWEMHVYVREDHCRDWMDVERTITCEVMPVSFFP